MYLAQVNIARLRYPADDPRLADFVNNLDRINEMAERMPGFVWRLRDDNGNAMSIQAFGDPNIIINLSVWEDAESLELFVWKTAHRQIYARKAEWFEPLNTSYFAMWWIDPEHRPDPAEARRKLDQLDANGSGDDVFGWEDLPHLKEWMVAQCA